MRTRRSAYTLMELVLVVTIIALLTAVTYPSLDSMYGDYKVTSAVDQVRAAWALCRAQALTEGRPYRFAVVPNKGNYRFAPDSGEYWAGNSGPTSTNPDQDKADPPLIREEALPRGVRFVMADAASSGDFGPTDANTLLPPGSVDLGQYSSTVTFLADGTCRDDVQIVFSTKGARPVLLKLRGITGAVTARPYLDSASKVP